MPHEFDDTEALTGTWSKDNGRRYCSWKFDPATGLLRVKRGRTVWSRTLDLRDQSEDLRTMLPRIALDILNELPEQSDAA